MFAFLFRGEIEENGESWESIALEKDIIMPSVGSQGQVYVYHSNRMWSQVKTAASAIYANRQYLALHRKRQPERLADSLGRGDAARPMCQIIGDVFIHPTAQIDSSCVVSHG
jgi:mannose-1-phosphate guanylyltransferase